MSKSPKRNDAIRTKQEVSATGMASDSSAPPPSSKKISISEPVLKKIFLGSILLMLLITWFSGGNVGYHQDEIDMNLYGKANVAYYASMGKDTTYLGVPSGFYQFDSLLRYYGCGFEYLARAANKVAGTADSKQEFNVRHFVNQFLGILAILFTGLIARRLLGWKAAIIAAWLAFLSPSFSGQILFNTKDIPFCLGYVASLYYIIVFLEELPSVSWRTTFKLMAALFFVMDVRIGGVFLYLLLFSGIYIVSNAELRTRVIANFKPLIVKYVAVVVGSLTILVISWPYLLRSPIHNLIKTIGIVQRYPMKISVNFAGDTIDSLTLPQSYIPTLLLLTIPVFVLVFVGVGLVLAVVKYKTTNFKLTGLILFAAVFPVAFSMARNSTIYTGWRHFLFIYPELCVFAALGISLVSGYLKKVPLKIAFGVVCALGMAKPLVWSVKNHPYEYCYFNELAGGFKEAYYNYDNDYWQISMRKSMDWLMKTEPIGKTNDTVTIATNIPRILEYYITVQYPEEAKKIKFVKVGCTSRNLMNWKYAVFKNFMLKPMYLETCYPPGTTVYAEKIDGLPITVVLKDTVRLDMKAMQALSAGNFAQADSLGQAYATTTKDYNPAMDAYMALAKAYLNKNDDAIAAANRALRYQFSDELNYNALCAMSIAYANKHEYELALQNLANADAIMPQNGMAKEIMQHVQGMIASENARKTN